MFKPLISFFSGVWISSRNSGPVPVPRYHQLGGSRHEHNRRRDALHPTSKSSWYFSTRFGTPRGSAEFRENRFGRSAGQEFRFPLHQSVFARWNGWLHGNRQVSANKKSTTAFVCCFFVVFVIFEVIVLLGRLKGIERVIFLWYMETYQHCEWKIVVYSWDQSTMKTAIAICLTVQCYSLDTFDNCTYFTQDAFPC